MWAILAQNKVLSFVNFMPYFALHLLQSKFFLAVLILILPI